LIRRKHGTDSEDGEHVDGTGGRPLDPTRAAAEGQYWVRSERTFCEELDYQCSGAGSSKRA
jgi:hypothetical protein